MGAIRGPKGSKYRDEQINTFKTKTNKAQRLKTTEKMV